MSPIIVDRRPYCPTCGHRVHVQSADEGTSFYEPDVDECRERVIQLDELAAAHYSGPARIEDGPEA